MKKKSKKIISAVTAVLMAAVMMPSFAFADTYADKTADGDYHYASFGDSVTAGLGPAFNTDVEFQQYTTEQGAPRIYWFGEGFDSFPKGVYTYLLAEKLNNHINATSEDTVNFKRNEDCRYTKVDENNIFSFSNLGFPAVNTETMKIALSYKTESSEKEGTKEFYEDLFNKNFLNDEGEYISELPKILASVRPPFSDNGNPNKEVIGKYFYDSNKKYTEELKKADVSTICIGLNDILLNVLSDMDKVLKDDESGLFSMLISSMTSNIDLSKFDISKLKKETLVELLEIVEPANMKDAVNRYVEEGIDNYRDTLDIITNCGNEHNSIALIGLYPPYGTSFKIGEKNYTFPVVTGDILDGLDELVNSEEYKALGSSDKTASASLSAGKVEEAILKWIAAMIYKESGIELKDIVFDKELISSTLKEFKGLSSEYKSLLKKIRKNVVPYSKAIRTAKNANEAQKELITKMLMNNIRLPLMYSLVGTTTDEAVEKYNVGIKKLADEYGLKYVDIFELELDDDPDVHPSIEAHKWMTDRIFSELKDIVPPVIKASDMGLLKTAVGKGYVKVTYSAKNPEDAAGYNIQYKVKGADKWKKAASTGKTAFKINNLKKGRKYTVRVRTYNKNSYEKVYGNWKTVISAKVK